MTRAHGARLVALVLAMALGPTAATIRDNADAPRTADNTFRWARP